MSNKILFFIANTAWSMIKFREDLLKSLVNEGYSIYVLAPYDQFYTSEIEKIGCKFLSLKLSAKGVNPFADTYLIYQIRSYIKQVKPDLIFCYTIKPNIYGVLASRITKTPVIAVTTGLGYTFINSNIVSRISKILYRFSFRFANEVWFLNEDDQQSFLELKLVNQDKTFILKGEGVNTDKFAYSNLNSGSKITFLFIGRMLIDKGVREFINAAQSLKLRYENVSFKMLGACDVDNPAAIDLQALKNWSSDGVIEYLGVVDNVVPIIKEADCVVLPSYREGIPISLLEALSMGRPIVTTDAIGCKDVIRDNYNGFKCEIKDHLSLANAIEKFILLDSDKRLTMSRNARLFIEKEFCVTKTISTYLETINRYEKSSI